MIYTTKSGNPYKTEASARAGAVNSLQHGLKCKFEVIEKDGGWVIETDEEPISEPTLNAAANELLSQPTHEELTHQEKLDAHITQSLIEASGDWKPSKLLDIPAKYKDKAFRYRWCNTNADGNILKKESEGWIIDREISKLRGRSGINRTQIEKDFNNNTQEHGTVTMLRELVLMKIPVAMAEARSKFYRDKSALAVAQTEQLAMENGQAVAGAYGKVSIGR
jgi:hypothetical protein